MENYNIDLLKYDCYQNGKHFVNQLFSYGFYPLIKSPTDVTGITSTLIDNIYTNEIGVHLEIGIMVNDISHHLPIISLLEYKSVKNKSATSSYKFVLQTRDSNINNFTENCNLNYI